MISLCELYDMIVLNASVLMLTNIIINNEYFENKGFSIIVCEVMSILNNTQLHNYSNIDIV